MRGRSFFGGIALQRVRTRWIVGGLVGWFAVARYQHSDAIGSTSPGQSTLIALQQAVFLICGIMGADWTQFTPPSGRSLTAGALY